MIDICRKSLPRHRVALFSQTATATDLWDNGGRNNTQDRDLKCPGGHPRQQRAARMTPRMSSLLPCCPAALLPCCLVALLPCCLAPLRSKRDSRYPRRPWRISALLSAVSPKEPPEKGWSAQALSFDLQVFTCHGLWRSRQPPPAAHRLPHTGCRQPPPAATLRPMPEPHPRHPTPHTPHPTPHTPHPTPHTPHLALTHTPTPPPRHVAGKAKNMYLCRL